MKMTLATLFAGALLLTATAAHATAVRSPGDYGMDPQSGTNSSLDGFQEELFCPSSDGESGGVCSGDEVLDIVTPDLAGNTAVSITVPIADIDATELSSDGLLDCGTTGGNGMICGTATGSSLDETDSFDSSIALAINTTTGVITFTTPTGSADQSYAVVIDETSPAFATAVSPAGTTTTPEPGTSLLLGLGIVGLCLLGRARTRASLRAKQALLAGSY